MRDVRIEMEQTAGEFGVMQTTLEQYIAHAYGEGIGLTSKFV